MDAENTTGAATPPPVPDMDKKEVVKDDGRLLIFYTFSTGHSAEGGGPSHAQEAAHV